MGQPEHRNWNRERQSGPGAPPGLRARFWRSLLIYVCCAALGVGVLLATPEGSSPAHLLLRFLTAAAVVAIAQALVLVACPPPVSCVTCGRERQPEEMVTPHLCLVCVEASRQEQPPPPPERAA